MLIGNSNSQRLVAWLISLLFGPGAPQVPIDLALYHAGVDDSPRLLRRWSLDGAPEREQVHELVDEIDRQAAQDAEGLGHSLQRYLVRAFVSGGREIGSLTLKYTAAPSGEPFAFSDSEPATSRGLNAMLMRHVDGAYRLLSVGYAQMNEVSTRRMAQQDALIERMSTTQIKIFETLQELAEKKLERDVLLDRERRTYELEALKETKKLEQQDMLLRYGMTQLNSALPHILNRLARTEAVPGTTSPRDTLMADFVKSVSRDQFSALSQVLTPAQMTNLMSIFDVGVQTGGTTAGNAASASSDVSAADKEKLDQIYASMQSLIDVVFPWAERRLQAGQPLDPSTDLPKETQMLRKMMTILPCEDYQLIATTDAAFKPHERELFAKILESLGLLPTQSTKSA